jgi:hypothetical protein
MVGMLQQQPVEIHIPTWSREKPLQLPDNPYPPVFSPLVVFIKYFTCWCSATMTLTKSTSQHVFATKTLAAATPAYVLPRQGGYYLHHQRSNQSARQSYDCLQ